MTHKIGRIRRRARRVGQGAGRSASAAMRAAVQSGNLQAKLKVGPQNDAYEREADSVAAQVMDGHSVAPAAGHAEGAMQRKCDECEAEEAQRMPMLQRQAEEEEEELQAKRRDDVQRQPIEEEEEELQAKRLDSDLQRQVEEEEEEEMIQPKARADGSFSASAGVSAQVAGLKSGGQGLPTSARRYFEPRFGADFSDVRVHTGPRAQAAAKALNARAFTTGRDVVFGPGEYAPGTRRGGELLAHELTHVIQQRGYKRTPDGQSEGGPVQRWQIGAAPAPAQNNWRTVPDGTVAGETDHTARLTSARTIVARLLNSTRCQNYFENNCDAGTANSLRDSFNNARVYFLDQGGDTFGENPIGSNDVAYNRTAFRMGKWFLAASLLHEIYHSCAPGDTDAEAEIKAENAVERCRLYAPFLQSVSPASGAVGDRITLEGTGLGPRQGPVDRVELNGVTCPVVSWTQNAGASGITIVVTVPAGATSGNIRVLNNNVASNPMAFTVT
ncbi:MAG: DUF4157 domain-containing protein [Pseudomonadota bacterium]